MQRLIPYLTLPLTLFVFISVILINIGGVNPGSNSSLAREKNSAFEILTWNYTITPEQSFQSYSYNLYLNRICYLSQSVSRGQSVAGYCNNGRGNGKLQDGRSFNYPNALVQDVNPFRFDTVNLSIPFAFYVLTAICVFLLLFVPVLGGKRVSRVIGFTGALLSGLGMIFIVVASAVLTRQMSHLKDQIRRNTRTHVNLPTTQFESQFGGTSEYSIVIQDVSLGSVIQGLTWAAVVCMIIEFVMYTWAALTVKKQESRMATKHEQYLQG